MAEHVIRLPDVGEGIAEAELVEWHVKVGDLVRADATLAAVMTDKATVEIPSPVDGEITLAGRRRSATKSRSGRDLVRLKIRRRPGCGERSAAATTLRGRRDDEAASSRQSPARPTARSAARPPPRPRQPASASGTARRRGRLPATARAGAVKPVASPAVRLRARGGGHRPASGTGHRAGRPHHARRPRYIRRPRSPRDAIAGGFSRRARSKTSR